MIYLSRMKNSNIKKYAERAVCENGKNTKSATAIKILKVVYWLAAAGAIVTVLTLIIGNLVTMSEYSTKANTSEVAKYNEQFTQFITMCVALFALVASYFLLHFKLGIPFLLVGSVDCIIVFTTLYSVSVTNDVANGGMTAFWIMAIPSMLTAALAVALGILLFVTYRLKIPKEYDRLIAQLYSSYTKNGEIGISAEEFEIVCNGYNGEEIFRSDIPLKKSLRLRKAKQESEK